MAGVVAPIDDDIGHLVPIQFAQASVDSGLGELLQFFKEWDT